MTLQCSICGESYEFDDKDSNLPPHFPFCSSHCKTVDLGKWFNEEYKISTPLPNINAMTTEEREAFAQILSNTGRVEEIENNDE